MNSALELFGEIDIYLFDQILKNRFDREMTILDAGFGGGRNLYYFLRNGFKVFGVDQNPEAVSYVRAFAGHLPKDNFRVSAIEKMPFESEIFDVVISCAVLHFAENEAQFNQMFDEMWRVLKPNGILFARLASSIGIESLIESTGNGRYFLPDGSERFLVSEEDLISKSNELGANWLEPLKTTNVQNLRCMTTIVWSKN